MIKHMTNVMLLQEILLDEKLVSYSMIIVNGAHEWIIHTLNIDKILVISSIAHLHHSWMDFPTTTRVSERVSLLK
jgi:HrpA-like RNA helicase